MTDNLLLTFNAGSSTVKIGIFKVDGNRPERIGKAVVDFGTSPLTLHLKEGPEQFELPLKGKAGDDLADLMDEVFRELGTHFDLDAVTSAGHRIVHGGDVFDGPVELTTETIAKVRSLTELAPLHQPQALRMIRAVRHLRPALFQTGSFDTTFHTTQSDLVRRLAIPRAYHDQGIKRYGFHGLSYRYVAGALARTAPDIADGKVVIAHLGSGASLCAIEHGESRDSSMGFSTLDGIPMATRPGWLDPGVLLHFLGPLGKSLEEVEDMLYHKSGLLGVSGFSGDTRELIEDGGAQAREAIDLFTLRIAGEVGRLASTLGGLDALVFTAGIGENQPQIRKGVTEQLLWLGVELDATANEKSALTISTAASRIAVHVIPTDEEQMIAEECLSVLHAKDHPAAS
ncbi:acetate/propionate family kinase [Neorhizobium galegae]|uniref:acetate/propionate family kinase n=1 Tax=Neorhizobium galegae TaxID=399 RepID=UPI000621EDD5|nr:acetate/propionate family kinase [Neorhizobium galegae]KAB1126951.1 acetate/propionate family kinase [Neorhizobium galegae]MCQ1808643.1 acetate/propionate family kinase [Neorhizobium galegae]CDZ57141.1 Acetate kinase [Neorhizobium galegae bv. orientalis]